MSRVTYARCAALVPIAFPLLGFVLSVGQIRGVFAILLVATEFAALPYLTFAAIALWWLRGRSFSSYWKLACFAPPIFASVMIATIVIVTSLLERRSVVRQLGDFAPGVALYALLIGYFYVLVAWACYQLLKATGAFRGDPSESPLQRPAAGSMQ